MENGWCGRLRRLSAPQLNISPTARNTTSNFWEAGLRKTRNSPRGRLIFRLAYSARRKWGLSRLGRWIFQGHFYYRLLEDHELSDQPTNSGSKM
jgi:hypothetical protein